MGFFRRRELARPIFRIGKYRLDACVEGLQGLTEFSEIEYKIIPRSFVGETNYNAPPVIFLCRPWSLQLQTVAARIRKIGVYQLIKGRHDATPLATETLRFCIAQLGKPSERRTGWSTWDALDGNVILQTAWIRDGFAINLFLTARSIRNLPRIG